MLSKALRFVLYTLLVPVAVCWAADTAIVAGSPGDTRLPDAAQQGDRASVRSLLAQKVDVNSAQGDGMTALHWAAYINDPDIAQMLLKAGASVKAETKLQALTPLFLASKAGYAGILELLLNAGADANAANANGTTPLMLAAGSGNVDAVKILLAHRADVNAKEMTWGETPLMFASALNREDVVKLLIARGADPKATSRVERLDTNKGYDPDAVNEAPKGAAEAGKAAAEDPAKIEQRKKAAARRAAAAKMRSAEAMGGMSALHFAAREGHVATVQSLVQAGADINQPSAADQTTPLLQAIYNGHYDVAKYMLDHGADPKLANVDGLAPLYAAVDMQWANRTWYPPANIGQEQANYLDLMKQMLDLGADPNVRVKKKVWFRRFHDDWIDSPGATAFWRAAQANDLAAMKLLIAHGADPNIRTIHDASALQAAAGYGFEDQLSTIVPDARFEVVKYMVDELHMDVNAKDDFGYTPLHGAAYVGNNELVKFLVARGADVHAKSHGLIQQEGQTVYEAAQGGGDTVADMANGPRTHGIQHPDTVTLLESLGSANSHNCRSAVCLPGTNATRP